MAFFSHSARRKPPRARYRGRRLSDLCDRRLHYLSSPRRRCSDRLRAGLRVEMGWRFVFGSSPEEAERRDADRQIFEEEAMPA